MFTSEAVTRGIKVRVESEYAPERSQPSQNQWFFLYTITISNEGTEPAQLMTRHWIISDGRGAVHEVEGEGVIGEQPVLAPGAAYDYVSGCPLTTPSGAMQGSYGMVGEDGSTFDVAIPRFALMAPVVAR